MRLTINGEQVSYSLENERTLGEVVRGIQAWLAGSGFLVTGMRAARASADDTQDLLKTAPEDWGGTSVDSVKELDVQAAHTGELRLAHWRSVDVWLEMLAEEILPTAESAGSRAEMPPGAAAGEMSPGAVAADSLESLLADLPETIESLRANPFLPPGSDLVDRFSRLLTGQAADQVRRWPAEASRTAAALINDLRGALQGRIADAARPADALARCAVKVRDSLGQLPEVSLLLQTGRDKDAMDIVIRFADTVQALLVLVPFLTPDPERGKLLAELTPVLKELVAAFGAKDSILIGDLLEYEIAPRMQRLAPLLGKAP